MKKFIAWIIIIALLITLVVLIVQRVNDNREPTSEEAFAQCLDESGTTFYGAYWCPRCAAQKALFGRAQKELPYVECSTPNRELTSVCADAGIESYPTWEGPDGTRITGERTFEELSELSGCPLPNDLEA